MSHLAPKNIGQSTQLEHPWRATLRTFGLYLVIAVPLLNVALTIGLDELAKAGVVLPDNVSVVVNAIVVGTGVLIAAVNRIIVLPGFNALLTQIGFGPVAKPTE